MSLCLTIEAFHNIVEFSVIPFFGISRYLSSCYVPNTAQMLEAQREKKEGVSVLNSANILEGDVKEGFC